MKEKSVIFSDDEFKTKLIPLIEEGLTVPLTVKGGSMSPFLESGRDTVMISKPSDQIKKGDVLFYERSGGQLVMHRVCKVRRDGYYFAGDAQTVIEGPIVREQIFGAVNKVIRKGKTVERGSFVWFFFRHVWVNMIPIRRLCVKLAGKLKRKKK